MQITKLDRLGVYVVPDAANDFNRDDFKSDHEYLDAIATENVRRSAPEYQAAYKAAAEKLAAWQREKDMKEAERQFEEIKKNIKIPQFKQDELKNKASNKAASDLSSGKITAKDFESTVKKYYDDLCKGEINTRAVNEKFNKMLRREKQSHLE